MLLGYRADLARRTERSLVYRLVHRLFYFHLTPAGRAVFWVFLISSSVSLFSFVIKAYVLWCALFALCLGSVIFSRIGRARLEVGVDAPDRVRCGQEFRIDLRARNLGRNTARDLRLQFFLPRQLVHPTEVSYLAELKPGQSHDFVQKALPRRRGAYKLDHLLQESCYPFGLWRDSVRHPFEQTVLVYPSYRPIRALDIPVGMRYQPGGLALTSYLGDSTEFLSTREFRSGDPLRHIHWRSWARTGKPIVKEYGEEYFCRLALIVDTVLANPQDPMPLESAISLSAAITEYLSRQEYVIDLFAAGPKLYYLQAGRSLAYLQNIMDVLACLEPTPPDDESFLDMETALLEEIEGISTTILVFTDWDRRRRRLLDELAARGTSVLAFLVCDDEKLARELPDNVRWLTLELVKNGIDVL
jgi:uncharacterized protein (DUF58 family)